MTELEVSNIPLWKKPLEEIIVDIDRLKVIDNAMKTVDELSQNCHTEESVSYMRLRALLISLKWRILGID